MESCYMNFIAQGARIEEEEANITNVETAYAVNNNDTYGRILILLLPLTSFVTPTSCSPSLCLTCSFFSFIFKRGIVIVATS